MMDLNFTKEELDALKLYKDERYEAMNQLLVSNSETDIALLSDEVENKVVKILYNRESIIEDLMNTKQLYRLFLKNFYKTSHKKETFYRGTNLAEIERLKREPFIDRIWAATTSEEEAEKYATNWSRPVGIKITLEENVPFINVGEILKVKKENNTRYIAPFTKIKSIDEVKEINSENSKYFKFYNIVLEKQDLDKLTDRERNGLYNYILENSYSIKRRLDECIKLETENSINFDNIRKMEQLLHVYENSMDEKETDGEYSDVDRTADYNDIERVSKELDELKKISTNVFEIRKQNIEFINVWKRNIAVYMIAECKEIEWLFKDLELPEFKEEETKEETIENKEEHIDNQDTIIVKNVNSVVAQEIPGVKIVDSEEESDDSEDDKKELEITQEDVKQEDIKQEEVEQEETENKEEPEIEENEVQKRVKQEAKENVDIVKELLGNIKSLISKQQNHAKIAGNMGSSYSALNNAFEMRKSAEALLELVEKVEKKVNKLCLEEYTDRIQLDLELISKTNIEIGTLLNYLNNPKIVVRNSQINRFDEMAIIEENELKRGIAEKIREIRGEAELKKLKDDLEIIEEKGRFSRFIGLFTGKNKIDDFMIEQIEYRQMAIRKTLARKLVLSQNYSIHELMAEITMFIDDNEDDELVSQDVINLKALAEELRRNYIILESKVQSIIEEKEGKNLPYDNNRKMTKQEIIEFETKKFLGKYGYDAFEKRHTEEEPKYQDTTTNEINRIIEYVNSANII